MTAQPPPEPQPDEADSSAVSPSVSYGAAPDPSGAYPGPAEGGFTPLPDLVPDEHARPGPGYGPESGDEPEGASSRPGIIQRLRDRLTRR